MSAKFGLIAGLFLVAAAAAPCAYAQTSTDFGSGSEAFIVTDADIARTKDYEKKWLHGSLSDQVARASLAEQGLDREKPDLASALDIYEKVADGNAIGREKMCVAYLLGEGRPFDLAKAMSYCNKLKDDDPVAMFSAGYDYDHGVSGPKDADTAIAFYAQAIKLGQGDAMDAVGEKALAAANPTSARRWFRQAAMAGSADGMTHLAALLETDQGGPADLDEAFWLYANAGRRGNADAIKWLSGHAGHALLPVSALSDKKHLLLSQTFQDATGKHVQPFDFADIIKALGDSYPKDAVNDQTTGWVSVHCYINGNHVIDLCITQAEQPIGYSFGRLVTTMFDGTLTAEPLDISGKPTANSVTVFTFNWTMRN